MQVVYGTERFDASPRPILTIGNFDGVHQGHRALVALTRELADSLDAPAAALTFDPAPQEVLRPGRGVPRIQTLDQRLDHLARTGLDVVIVEPFTETLGQRSPDDFARHVLVDRLRVRGLALGHDFRFGKGRAGTAATLGDLLDVPIRQVTPCLMDGTPVSSSRIRAALGEGDVGTAARLLGRPHEISGRVVRGEQRGRTLGFPTANLADCSGLVPRNGVYAVRADGRVGVANLGTRPTFDGQGVSVEVHLLDFSGDLYGGSLTVTFEARLRDERRFDDIAGLVSAIEADVAAARAHLL